MVRHSRIVLVILACLAFGQSGLSGVSWVLCIGPLEHASFEPVDRACCPAWRTAMPEGQLSYASAPECGSCLDYSLTISATRATKRIQVSNPSGPISYVSPLIPQALQPAAVSATPQPHFSLPASVVTAVLRC
jgi:hypothetical protein